MPTPPIPTELTAPKRRSFLRNSLETVGSEVGVAVLSLLNVIIVARALGAEGRGEVAFLTAIAYLVSSSSTLGVQEANVNLAGEEPALRRSLAGNSLVFSILTSLASYLILLGLVAAVPSVGGEGSRVLLWATLAFLPVLVLNYYLRFLIQGDYGFGITNLAWLVPAVVNLSLNGALALAGSLSVATAVGTWLAGQAIATGILAWYVHRRSVGFGRPDLGLARRSLSFGLRSHVGRVMILANYRLDQWILGALAGATELGLYSVAVAWAEALFLLPTALSAVQRPDLVRASQPEAVAQASRIFRGSMIITVVAGIVIIAAAPVLCVGVFGEEFSGSVDQLRLLVGGAFGIVALKQLGSSLTARRRPTIASVTIAAAFVATVVLDALLIPEYGGVGAAIASASAYTFGGIIVVIAFTRALGGRVADLVPRAEDVRWLLATGRTLATSVRGRHT